MTETTITPEASTPAADAAAAAPRKTGGGLGGKVLAELQAIAGELGISGAEKMRKGALIDAIKIARGDAGTSTKAAVAAAAPSKVDTSKGDAAAAVKTEQPAEAPVESKSDSRKTRNEPKNDAKPESKGIEAKPADGKPAEGAPAAAKAEADTPAAKPESKPDSPAKPDSEKKSD